MVLAEAVAGVVGGVKGLFDYNRSNYMYDRRMRQETEFKILEYRNLQSGLWREDVKDLIGLTERKMDSYLIVNTLQLSMCVMLFAEGRLEPGTPPWLLHLYMLTLAGAFMYLLMSVWLAMHASIVAQVSAVRLLTQFVRLPIPRWQQLQAMRTYGVTYEKLDVKKVMRVPFLSAPPVAEEGEEEEGGDDMVQDWQSQATASNAGGRRSAAGMQRLPSASAGPHTARSSASNISQRGDPWGLEMNGRAPYELQQRAVRDLRHVNLVRHEAVNYQSHDAFARVAMSFGTNQLLYAICYYVLGYVNVMDGAPWGALTVAAVMVGIAVALVQLDLSLSWEEHLAAQVLIAAGPAFASAATCIWDVHTDRAEHIAMMLLPFAFFSHGFWLLWSLGVCQAEPQPNGAILPMKFTAVLNLDVFGWFRSTPSGHIAAAAAAPPSGYEPLGHTDSWCDRDDFPGRKSSSEKTVAQPQDEGVSAKNLQEDLAMWESDHAQKVLSEEERKRVSRLAQKFRDVIEEEYRVQDGAGAGVLALPAPGPAPARAAPVTSGSKSSQPSAPLSLPPPPPTKWLQLKHHPEHSNDATPCLYEPSSGQICAVGDVQRHDANGTNLVRSLTEMEQSVESLCDNVRSSASAGSLPTLEQSRLLMRRPPRRAATLPTAIPNLTTLCEEPSSFVVTEDEISLEAEHERFVQNCKLEETLGKGLVDGDAASDDLGSESDGGASAGEVESEVGQARERQACNSQAAASSSSPKHQGRIPWWLLRSATLLLVTLWACGTLLAALVAFGVVSMPSRPWDAEALRSVRDRPESSTSALDNPALQFLPQGLLLDAQWPRQPSFVPRAMSCDRSGSQLVVADDFGVYAAQIPVEPAGSGTSGSAGTPVTQRRLRASRQSDSETAAAASRASTTATFARIQPCPAFEGQMLKDIAVVCSESAQPLQVSKCRVLVLHSQGRSLTECPLQAQHSLAEGDHSGPAAEAKFAAELRQAAAANVTWRISADWLQPEEHVEKVSVNPECLQQGEESATAPASPRFDSDRAGCFVAASTSRGRMVQLRRHLENKEELVPDWSMYQAPAAQHPRSLHVVLGSVLMLWPKSKTVQALSGDSGDVIGEWKLPQSYEWLAFAGGSNSLYLLGQNSTSAMSLWRFPLPKELLLWAQERASMKDRPEM